MVKNITPAFFSGKTFLLSFYCDHCIQKFQKTGKKNRSICILRLLTITLREFYFVLLNNMI